MSRHDFNFNPPDRWLNCPRKSEGFIADKFIVFKTPLDSKYDVAVPLQCRFPPKMLLEHVKMKQLKIGLWIDLTNTDRFYSPTELPGIEYVKLKCRGHGETPSGDQVKKFIEICRNFISNNDSDIIAVHCTHGFNRSGFMICSFLYEEYGYCITAAILSFAKFRPPGIYKEDYLQVLFSNHGEDDEDMPKAPERPDWCNEQQGDDDDEEVAVAPRGTSRGGRSGDPGEPQKKRKREFFKENPEFMKGVENVEAIMDRAELSRLQHKVQGMCEWSSNGFPGSQPVSMDTQNILKLQEKPYMVSWKADGTRYLLLIEDRNSIYFVDRDNCVFQVYGITFPYKKDFGQHLRETLVDGEMVVDVVNGVSTPRFLIYDIIKFNGQDTGKCDFRRRLTCIKDEIVNPRYAAIVKGLIDRQHEPFGVRLKEFWPIEYADKILNGGFAAQLPHEPDGLIFQPQIDPYVSGRCDDVLKWKPPELNTIDFKLKICMQTGEGILPTRVGELYVGQLLTPFDFMKPVPRNVIPLDGKIIECKWDGKGWRFLRERTDKSFPNAYATAKAVALSIRYPVTKNSLLEFIMTSSYGVVTNGGGLVH